MGESFLHFIIQYYGFALMATLLFLYFILANKSFSLGILNYFYAALFANVALAISDICHSYYAMLSYPTWQRMLFAASSYSLRIFVILCILLLFCRERSKKFRYIITIPAIINVIASFSAFFTTKAFYYTSENIIVRGPIITIPFIVSGLYFIFLIYESMQKTHKDYHQETIIVYIIFVMAIAATLLEAKFHYYGMLPALGIVGVMVYYMYFMSDKYSYDSLTDAEIRTRLYENYMYQGKSLGIIMYDLNDLKKINDSKGHAEGDRALKTVAKAVLDVLPQEARLYRIGGDEFVVITLASEEDEVKELAMQIKDAIFATPYTAAVGYNLRDADEPIEKALSRADEAMYENKRIFKDNNKN